MWKLDTGHCPNEVNDGISEDLREKGAMAESFVYGSSDTGDAEGLAFPDLKLEGEDGLGNREQEGSSSWFW